MYKMGLARPGPTLREAVLLHAVARLALPNVPSLQTSWTKMGRRGAAMALRAGANDLGGTLMNERISRAAGAAHGQEMTPAELRAIAAEASTVAHSAQPDGAQGAADAPGVRAGWQRTTLYAPAAAERRESAERAAELLQIDERTQRPAAPATAGQQ